MYAYYLQRVGQQKGRIELAGIKAVEYVETSAFHLAHTLQVSKGRPSYQYYLIYTIVLFHIVFGEFIFSLERASSLKY